MPIHIIFIIVVYSEASNFISNIHLVTPTHLYKGDFKEMKRQKVTIN